MFPSSATCYMLPQYSHVGRKFYLHSPSFPFNSRFFSWSKSFSLSNPGTPFSGSIWRELLESMYSKYRSKLVINDIWYNKSLPLNLAASSVKLHSSKIFTYLQWNNKCIWLIETVTLQHTCSFKHTEQAFYMLRTNFDTHILDLQSDMKPEKCDRNLLATCS